MLIKGTSKVGNVCLHVRHLKKTHRWVDFVDVEKQQYHFGVPTTTLPENVVLWLPEEFIRCI